MKRKDNDRCLYRSYAHIHTHTHTHTRLSPSRFHVKTEYTRSILDVYVHREVLLLQHEKEETDKTRTKNQVGGRTTINDPKI